MGKTIELGDEKQSSDQTNITDNLTLLDQELGEDSLAARLVQAYRDSDDPSEALTTIIGQRLEQLREEHAEPKSQDD